LSSSHWRASVVLPYPAGATRANARAVLASRIRVSRGRLMMCLRASGTPTAVSTKTSPTILVAADLVASPQMQLNQRESAYLQGLPTPAAAWAAAGVGCR